METRLLICSGTSPSVRQEVTAAAVAVAATPDRAEQAATLMLDLRSRAPKPRGTLLASSGARALEAACNSELLCAAARGRICVATPARGNGLAALDGVLPPSIGEELLVLVVDSTEFREALEELELRGPSAVLLRAPRGGDGPLIALLAEELRERRIPLKVWSAPIGLVASRRVLAGLEPAGDSGRRAGRLARQLLDPVPRAQSGPPDRASPDLRSERAQALPAVLGVAVLVIAVALILVAVGGAATAKGRMQRAVDLSALSAARSMKDDFPRLFIPPRLPGGAPNPAHLERSEYLDRARAAAMEAVDNNEMEQRRARVSFPDGDSFAPLRVEVSIKSEIEVGGKRSGGETSADAEAEVSPPSAVSSGQPAVASGGGYAGPLAYRQGKPMRPDVAAAFDRMSAAAAAAGVTLTINSAFRSDAEQQRLWEQNPDPRWVAPPGTSLHRCGTELDLGSSAAYGWLATNARHFGFVQRYSWEAWHYGFTDGPEPCSAAGDRISSQSGSGKGSKSDAGGAGSDGRGGAGEGLPGFVPGQYRQTLLDSASRHDVSAALLAAQIMAESNFNPNAVSPAGAQGIAQFMPGTAAAYGLDDPFDPAAAIDAQAQMMAELLGMFGSVELALAAYNAGPGAVSACNCIPPYPETQAYVARILALLDGAGQLGTGAPELEIRLVD